MSWGEDLRPPAIWEHFYQLTRIPRPSHHEEQISAFLANFGRDLGLDTAVDEVGNVLIRKPASAGMEDCPGVILQAHMDMVPEKAPGNESRRRLGSERRILRGLPGAQCGQLGA